LRNFDLLGAPENLRRLNHFALKSVGGLTSWREPEKKSESHAWLPSQAAR